MSGSFIDGHQGYIIGSVTGNDNSGYFAHEDEAEANARLFVAAPDLYEALANLENDAGQIPEHAWKLVQAALKKARGEE